MAVGSGVDFTIGCVSVCTKSVFVATVVVGAWVVVMVGMDAVFVVSVAGVTFGFFGRHAGASTAPMIARPQMNDFTALGIFPPTVWMISTTFAVGRWPLTDKRNGQRPTANSEHFRAHASTSPDPCSPHRT